MLCLFIYFKMKMPCFGKLTHFLMFGYDPKNEQKKKSNDLGRTKNN